MPSYVATATRTTGNRVKGVMMYGTFIETVDGNFAIIAPSRHRAAARETAIWLAHRRKSQATCEFLQDEDDALAFVASYEFHTSMEKAREIVSTKAADFDWVERIGF